MRASRQSSITGCHGDHYQADKLIQAARLGDLELIFSLLSSGVPVNSKDEEDRTALLWACAEGKADAVKILVGAGADVNRGSRHGSTPLIEAALWGHESIVKLLLQSGADVEARKNFWGAQR